MPRFLNYRYFKLLLMELLISHSLGGCLKVEWWVTQCALVLVTWSVDVLAHRMVCQWQVAQVTVWRHCSVHLALLVMAYVAAVVAFLSGQVKHMGSAVTENNILSAMVRTLPSKSFTEHQPVVPSQSCVKVFVFTIVICELMDRIKPNITFVYFVILACLWS